MSSTQSSADVATEGPAAGNVEMKLEVVVLPGDPDGNGWLLQEIKERLPGR